MGKLYDANAFDRLRKPTEDDLKNIGKALKLDEAQQKILVWTVNSGLEECHQFHARRISQPENESMHLCASDMDELLHELESKIAKSQRTINALGLPNNVGAIGRLLSFEAVAEISGREQVDCNLQDALAKMEPPTPITLLELEWRFAERKQLFDAHRRAELLLLIVRKMREQFTEWLDSELPDAAGPPPKPFRRIMLLALAYRANHILQNKDGPPALTRNGGARFLKLCVAVLQVCGIDGDDGAKDAIKNLFKDPKVWAAVSHWNELRS